jgi:hypothetical protein
VRGVSFLEYQKLRGVRIAAALTAAARITGLRGGGLVPGILDPKPTPEISNNRKSDQTKNNKKSRPRSWNIRNTRNLQQQKVRPNKK